MQILDHNIKGGWLVVKLRGLPQVKIDVDSLTSKPGLLLSPCVTDGSRMCWSSIPLIIDVADYINDSTKWSPILMRPLSVIHGVHPRHLELARHTDSPLNEQLYPEVSVEAVLDYLSGSPIMLMPLQGELFCVRGIQTYLWLSKQNSEPSLKVPVRIYSSQVQNRHYDDTLINNMLVPCLVNRAESLNISSVYRIWQEWLKISKGRRTRQTIRSAENQAGFARAVHVDKRNLK